MYEKEEDLVLDASHNNLDRQISATAEMEKFPTTISMHCKQEHGIFTGSGVNGTNNVTDTPDKPDIVPSETKLSNATSWNHQIPDMLKKNAVEEVEEEATLMDVKDAIVSQEFGSPGDKWTGGETKLLPVAPGLRVKGVGKISVPLTAKTADELKKVCLPATGVCGKEGQAIAVREVGADQVTLENPSWESAVDQLTRQVATDLGVNADLVSPRLDKLVLSEPGETYQQHHFSDLEAGIFASLIVQLPSDYTGGSIVVSHNHRESQYSMDSTNLAPFQCHFVARYSDCEERVLGIQSGYRLVLVYALRYSGSEASHPMAKTIKEGRLTSLLRQLRKSESLFAVPLEHKYEASSLERLGNDALKGSDRALRNSILRLDDWDAIVCKLDRLDTESGEDGYYGFQVEDIEYGTPIVEFIHGYGDTHCSNQTVIGEQLELGVGDEGAILGTTDRISKMWEEVDSTELEYTSKDTASRERTYHAYIIAAVSLSNFFERVCRHDFEDAIDQIEDDPCLLDRAIGYLERENSTLCHRHLLPLHELVQRNHSENGRYWSDMEVMFRCLDTSEVPPDEVIKFISSLLKSHGQCDKTNAIYVYLGSLCNIAKQADCLRFLKLTKAFVDIHAIVNDDSHLESLVTQMTDYFEASTTSRSGSHYRVLGELTKVREYLKGVLSTQPQWDRVAKVVKPCFTRMRKMRKAFPDQMADQMADEIQALCAITNTIEQSDVNEIRASILDDFILLLEAAKQNFQRSSKFIQDFWKNPKIEIIVRETFLYGQPTHFRRIETWVGEIAPTLLSTVKTVLQRVASEGLDSLSKDARDQCVQSVCNRLLRLEASKHEELENKLLFASRSGRPTSSWSMPNARTGNSLIDAFLYSDEEGPKEITIGGGINSTRKLVKRIENFGAVNFASPDARKCPRDSLNGNCFSATICNTEKIGVNASVIVKKTKHLFQIQHREYEKTMKMLGDVQAKLRKHRQVMQPDGQPAPKRIRPDVEVIVIE